METHKLQNLLIAAVLITLVLQVALSAVLLVRMNSLARMVSGVQHAVATSIGPFSQETQLFDAPIDGAPILGAPEAEITIVMFSDFACGACASILPTIKEVVEAYPSDVRLVHLDFPLNTDPKSLSMQAANAARCAGEQGRYWEMHDLIFANQDRASAGDFLAIGKEIGLDETPFSKCVDDLSYADDIMKDQAKGLDAGVNATPAVFVNGQALGDLLYLRQVVEMQLED